MDKLRKHTVHLAGETVALRPMTECDWEVVGRWNSNPEVLYYTEGDDVQAYTLGDVRSIYREASATAFCFIVEHDGVPIGDCRLQKMNLPRILERLAEKDCRKLDLTIGDKQWWGPGLATEVIRLLAAFGFGTESADGIFGCDIAEDNLRSLRSFRKAGFTTFALNPQPPGSMVAVRTDVWITREEWLAFRH